MTSPDPETLDLSTRLIRASQVRRAPQAEPHKQTPEAIYVNSGYVYDSAEKAEAALQCQQAAVRLFAGRLTDGEDVRGAPRHRRGPQDLPRHRASGMAAVQAVLTS